MSPSPSWATRSWISSHPAPNRAALLEGLGLRSGTPVVSVLPGSRPQEVAHNLPPLVAAIAEMHKRRPDVRFLLAVAPALDRTALRAPFGTLPVTAVQGQTHAALDAADVAIVASGTATVEAALLGTPMVVVYRVSPVTYALGRPFVRVPHFAMVNLIAEREVVKELMQSDFRAERVAEESLGLLGMPRASPGFARSFATSGTASVSRGPPPGPRKHLKKNLKLTEKKLDMMRCCM